MIDGGGQLGFSRGVMVALRLAVAVTFVRAFQWNKWKTGAYAIMARIGRENHPEAYATAMQRIVQLEEALYPLILSFVKARSLARKGGVGAQSEPQPMTATTAKEWRDAWSASEYADVAEVGRLARPIVERAPRAVEAFADLLNAYQRAEKKPPAQIVELPQATGSAKTAGAFGVWLAIPPMIALYNAASKLRRQVRVAKVVVPAVGSVVVATSRAKVQTVVAKAKGALPKIVGALAIGGVAWFLLVGLALGIAAKVYFYKPTARAA